MPALDWTIMWLSIVLYVLLAARNLDETEELVPFLFQKKNLLLLCTRFSNVFKKLQNLKITLFQETKGK